MLGFINKWYEKFFRKKVLQSLVICNCDTLADCPHTSDKDCKFDKKKCHLIAEKKNRKKNDHTGLRILFFVCIGLLFYVLSSIASKETAYSFKYSEFVYAIISGISISVIAGAILAKVIDLPSKLKDYETSFINALASNSYLKSLDESRLTKLRNDITEQLHKASAPSMAKGLINIDQRICELLRQPYYSRYRQSVVCSVKEGDVNNIIKKHIIDYKLINPYGINKEATEYISMSNLILLPESSTETSQTTDKAIKNLKIICKRDNEDSIEYKEGKDFQLTHTPINSNKEYYNTKIFLDSKNKKPSEQSIGIRIDFKDNIQIHMEYEIDVNIEDRCFTKRLQHPVKNFRLDYSCNDIVDTQLYGQIFGTELKQSDFSIQYPTTNSISLEAFDWLLPDNGALVVMLNNAKKSPEKK